MENFQEQMHEYGKQMQKGTIQKAYSGLMKYILALRTHFKTKYPDYFVSGDIYTGYMDMTYFSFSPRTLKDRNLKIAIVFIHDTCRFEAWLAGYNKKVQSEYWKLFKESNWNKYPLVPTTEGVDSIMESIIVDDPNFGDLPTLTKQIEAGTLNFIKDVESFLSNH